MNRLYFALWYFAVSITFIVLDNLHLVVPALFVKALIISSLMVFLHFSVRGRYGLFYRLVMAGLGFSLLGDVILELGDASLKIPVSPDLLFIGGLGAFLIAQLIYFISFMLPPGKNEIFRSGWYWLVLVLIYGGTMIYFILPGLGTMKIPVLFYTSVILLMLISALNRAGRVNRLSYLLVTTGAVFFVISDSLIAVNKFYMGFRFSGVFIMLTYVIAQYLIVLGSIQQNIFSAEKSSKI